MPLIQRSKRRATQFDDDDDDDNSDPSPGPSTQRRRLSQNPRTSFTQQRHADSDDDNDASTTNRLGIDDASQFAAVDDLAKKLVRFALACEFQRRPIRRADINERVLGTQTRKFREVWAAAQTQLETVFGMRMAELPAREKITVQQRRAAAKSNNAAKSAQPAPSWILTSILPPRYRLPTVLQPSMAPTSADESTYTAIYTVLTSLISLSGGTIPDAKLDRALRRLQLSDQTPLADYDRTDKLFKRLEKDGYLLKIKETTGAGEDDISWTLGPRARVEVGDDGVRGLVKAVFGEMPTEAAEEELENKITRSLASGTRMPSGNANANDGVGTGKKKRGRPRRDAEAEENGGGEEESEDDDD